MHNFERPDSFRNKDCEGCRYCALKPIRLGLCIIGLLMCAGLRVTIVIVMAELYIGSKRLFISPSSSLC